MKIIKSFRDDKYLLKKILIGDSKLNLFKYEWGLGDDGQLYCKYNYNYYDLSFNIDWELVPHNLRINDFRTMKKLLKEFEHLLVWI